MCVVAGKVVSKVVFYYTGTRFVRNQHDAAKRITIDVHHDLIVWGISLALGWQKYFYPQVGHGWTLRECVIIVGGWREGEGSGGRGGGGEEGRD